MSDNVIGRDLFKSCCDSANQAPLAEKFLQGEKLIA